MQPKMHGMTSRIRLVTIGALILFLSTSVSPADEFDQCVYSANDAQALAVCKGSNDHDACVGRLQDVAIAACDRLLSSELSPLDFSAIQSAKGLHLTHRKRYADAIKALDLMVHANPNYARGYLLAGYAHVKANRYAAAITDYDRAIGIEPDFQVAYAARGFAYSRVSKPSKRSGIGLKPSRSIQQIAFHTTVEGLPIWGTTFEK